MKLILIRKFTVFSSHFYLLFHLASKAFAGNDSGFDPNGWLSKMVKRPNDTLEERTKYLEQLLQGTGMGNDTSAGKYKTFYCPRILSYLRI